MKIPPSKNRPRKNKLLQGWKTRDDCRQLKKHFLFAVILDFGTCIIEFDVFKDDVTDGNFGKSNGSRGELVGFPSSAFGGVILIPDDEFFDKRVRMEGLL